MAAYGVPALGLLYLLYPSFFSGPMVEVDPTIIPIWLDKVTHDHKGDVDQTAILITLK